MHVFRVCPRFPLSLCLSLWCVLLVSVSLYRVCMAFFPLCVFVSLFRCAGSVWFLSCVLVFWFLLWVCVPQCLSVLCVYGWCCVCLWCLLFFCFLCGWSCLGLCVRVGCWVLWCVPLVCSVYVSVLLIVWCVFFVCASLLGVLCALCVVWYLYWFVVLGVLVLGLCLLVCCTLCGVFGVWLWRVSGFGRVLFFCFWVLAWFCFLVGCWGFVFWWVVACWFGWWFVFVGCLGGFCVLGVVGCVLFFWSYIICVDCGGALRVSACVGFLFGVTACFLGVCS